MSFQLTEEQRMFQDSLRVFIEKEIFPYEAEADRTGIVPVELCEQIKQRAIEMGFYAVNLPESVGGAGLDYTTLGLMERELGKASYGLGGNIARPTELLMACEGEQIEQYLKQCVTGEKHECFALTEPGAGSDIMAMTTRAVADGDDYLITGNKHFISSPCLPDFAILFAVTGTDETPRGPRKRITAFLVDRDEKGFEMNLGPLCAAQRAYRTYELNFDECRVNKRQILGEEGKGLELADKWLGMGRVWVGAQSCGKAERLFELAKDWAATRKQFGKPIGSFQGTSFKLADMVTELQAADLLVMNACQKADLGIMQPEDAAMAKLFASEMVGRVADNTVQIFGGTGLMEEMPVERLWRDARIERIWDGTSEIQRHIIARSILRPLGA
ncbi:acyl-CoA dehydrogenase family protein [Dasania marina]|uniref:acyl-CoA dehydrogenase family protein n=1 Tax=Dasania marina TaxID=471499 RepID=UPI00036532DF|nr:acyl-CoA dehydrogenase family protein [Dasania marina]|tara:strand:+ start:1160 stop:2320 length:1161 start_codon:yes stop_codon:yes gene_type:complete